MARKAPHPCGKLGCPKLVVNGSRCDEHRLPSRAWVRTPDARPSASARGYDYQWRNYRYAWFDKHPGAVCACGCGTPVNASNADIDHIVPVVDKNDPLFWDESNHQPLIHGHHSRKTRHQFARRGGVKS